MGGKRINIIIRNRHSIRRNISSVLLEGRWKCLAIKRRSKPLGIKSAFQWRKKGARCCTSWRFKRITDACGDTDYGFLADESHRKYGLVFSEKSKIVPFEVSHL